ncbi:MAG TPA: hypothetical protein EYQ69_01565 [Gemmatimonadetes bacterium]|jgi:peptidyl-prolyl cis-trans isomerase SurA|nr:hypothetical protein [Gemmatimonadota bacterium]
MKPLKQLQNRHNLAHLFPMTTCFFLFTILTLVQPVSGQTKVLGDNVVERVVALVGDSVILMTELDEYLMTLEAGGWARPDDPEELLTAKTQVLDQLVNQQLILLEAIKDTLLTVSDDELEERVQEEVAGQIRQFGTTKQFQDVLAEQNMTVNQFREQRKNMIRRDLLQERYFAKTGTGGDDFIITEEEARSFFEENRSQLPQVPATILFENFILSPEANDASKAEALAEAERLLEMAMTGEQTFAELATRFSDGPSAQSGGELGWIRRDGSMVSEFEEEAFKLSPGRISSPVETEFGYHLILLERVRGGERRVRHLLVEPEIVDMDIEANEIKALSFAEQLTAGELSIDNIGVNPDTLDLALGQIAEISPEYAAGMVRAKAGDIVGPIQLTGPRMENSWGIAKIIEMKRGGITEFEDVREMIEDRLRSIRGAEDLIEDLRTRTFIDIRLVPKETP